MQFLLPVSGELVRCPATTPRNIVTSRENNNLPPTSYTVGVPVAAYLTWQGKLIEGKGVSPGVLAEVSAEQLLAGEDIQNAEGVGIGKVNVGIGQPSVLVCLSRYFFACALTFPRFFDAFANPNRSHCSAIIRGGRSLVREMACPIICGITFQEGQALPHLSTAPMPPTIPDFLFFIQKRP
jgi:hypothetical protein